MATYGTPFSNLLHFFLTFLVALLPQLSQFPSVLGRHAGSDSGTTSSTLPRCSRRTRWQRRANANYASQ